MITPERIAEIQKALDEFLPEDTHGPNRFDASTGMTVTELREIVAKAQTPTEPDPTVVAENAALKQQLATANAEIAKVRSDLDAAMAAGKSPVGG